MSEEFQDSSKKSNGAFIAIIIILLLMLAGMAYIWSSKNDALNTCENKKKKVELQNAEMNNLMKGHLGDMSDNLLNDMSSMLNNYEELKKNGTPEQREAIEAQMAEIQILKDEIQSGKIRSAAGLARLRRENDELRSIMKGYVYEIDSLHTLNYGLRNDLSETTLSLDLTSHQRDSLDKLATDRGDKIKKGQKLSAYSISTVGLKQKLNNSMALETKAKKVVQIRSEFTVGKNPITDAGNKVVYLQIIDPSGKTLQASSSNVATMESGQVAYSDKKTINYTNQSIDVAIFYSLRGQVLSKGNYKVKIYCQGQLVGTDSFSLK